MSGVPGSQLLDDSFTLKKEEDAVKDEKKKNFVKVETSPKQLQMPVKFQMLRANTNLNEAPSNWMHDSSQWENYMQQASFPTDDLFSSFHMANHYLNLASKIDVISNSENIKKLLKIPFSQSNISMMVHRVGSTLMLDDFDVHRYLLKQQANDWNWLKKFYYDTVMENVKLPVIERVSKSRDYLKNRNMFSKFLYYSLAGKHPQATNQPGLSTGAVQETFNSEPDTSPPNLSHQRTLVWNFEDIRMLIGTDLPIFGGGTHPCVSLKLRDMKKPITVLTGLDYWLDNLMCNVPELAMCYHDDGIVQSYELLKTEDIPNFPEGKFSPNVIKDVAQNILSFLKSNATKEGHTYWLFKGHGDDIVKLYDLTTLCFDYNENGEDDNSKTCDGEDFKRSHDRVDMLNHQSQQKNNQSFFQYNDSNIPTSPSSSSHSNSNTSVAINPFTIPVGILLYRVAFNIISFQKCLSTSKKASVIKKLLRDCIAVLSSVNHYRVIVAAHYYLSDVYVCDHIDEEPVYEEGSDTDIEESSDNTVTNSEKYESSDDDMADHDKKKATAGYSYIKNKNSKLEGSSSTIDVQALSLHTKKKVNKNNNNGNIIDNNNGKNENNSKNNAEHQNLNDENAKPVINDYACMVKFEKSLKHILQSLQNCEKYEKLVIAKKQNEKGDNIETNVKIDDRCNYDEKSDFLEDNLNEINVAKRKASIYEKQARCNPFEAIPMHYEPIIKELNNQEHFCNFICNNNKNLNIVSHFEKANIANNDSKHVSNSNNDNDKKLVIYPQNDLQLKWIKSNETLNIARNELNSYSSDVYKTNDVLNTQNNLSLSHGVNVEIYTNNCNGTNCVQDDNLQRYSDHGFNNLSLSKLNDQLSVKKVTSKSVDEIINFNIIKELPFQDRLSNGIISFSEIRFCLIRKACIVFLKRAKYYLDAHILSTTTSTTKHSTLLSVLNDVTHSYNCYKSLKKLKPMMKHSKDESSHENITFPFDSVDPILHVKILSVHGDAYLHVAKQQMTHEDRWDRFFHLKNFLANDKRTKELVTYMRLKKYFNESDHDYGVERLPEEVINLYEKAIQFYSSAYEISKNYKKYIYSFKKNKNDSDEAGHIGDDDDEVNSACKKSLTKLANVHNEMATYYNKQLIKPGLSFKDCSLIMDNSKHHFNQSVSYFVILNDNLNAGLVNANVCNLERVRAQLIRNIQIQNCEILEFSKEERNCYKMAELGYIKSLEWLRKCNDKNAAAWCTISWDLSSVCVLAGSLLQDHPPLTTMSRQHIEIEVVEWLNKALKYCNFDAKSSLYVPAKYRHGHIHHRLASMYQTIYRVEENSQKRKKYKTLAEDNYALASGYYKFVDAGLEFIRLQMERVLIANDTLSNQTSYIGQLNVLKKILDCLLSCHWSLKSVQDSLTDLKNQFVAYKSGHEFIVKFIASVSSKPSVGRYQDLPNFLNGSSKDLSGDRTINTVNDERKTVFEESIFQESIKLGSIYQRNLASTLKSLVKITKTSKDPKPHDMYKAGYHKYLTSSCFHANFPLVDIDWADMEKDLKSVTSGILQAAEHEIRAPARANVADNASKTSTREQLSKILDDLLTCFKGLVDVVRELSSIFDYSAAL